MGPLLNIIGAAPCDACIDFLWRVVLCSEHPVFGAACHIGYVEPR